MGLAPAAVTAGLPVPAAQYGIGEEQLFAALEEQNEWWRDSTLERLLDRELSG